MISYKAYDLVRILPRLKAERCTLANVSENEPLIYDHIQAFIEPFHFRVSASYLFGFLIAKVLQGKIDPQACLRDLEQKLKLDEKRRERLHALAEHLIGYIYHNVTQSSIPIEQMLPSGDMPISARIFSLSEFIQAIVESMGNNLASCCQNTPELEEMFTDLKTLTEMDADEDDSEDTERNYIEIVEYVRVGILLMIEHSHFCIQEKQAKTEQMHH